MRRIIALILCAVCACTCFCSCGNKSTDVAVKCGSIEFMYDSSELKVGQYNEEGIGFIRKGERKGLLIDSAKIVPQKQNYGIDYYKQIAFGDCEIYECKEAVLKEHPVYIISYGNDELFSILIVAICEDQDYAIEVCSFYNDRDFVFRTVAKIQDTIIFK